MRRFGEAGTILLVCALMGAACGDDDGTSNEPVTPPELPERSFPVAGGPEDGDWEEPPPPEEFVPEDRVSEGSEDECCPVTFRYLPEVPPAGVESATLRGSLYPLNTADGVALTVTDGVWSGEACLAPDEFGTYYYALELRTSGEETFPTTGHNRYAPTTTAAGEIVNLWAPADDCASIDASVHAKTSE